MGFSIRIAPGVRVRASARGVRTSIGPRVARLHVGAGATGFSTGVGPLGYYTTVGLSGGQSSAGGTRAAETALLTAAQADKLERAYALGQALLAITKLHEVEFEPARRPVAPPSDPVDATAIRRALVGAALKPISIFKLNARRAATAEAHVRADAAVLQETLRRQTLRDAEQEHLDRAWNAILANEADAVMSQLAAAFEDNAAPAAPLAVAGDEASLAVMIPAESSLPDQMLGYTDAGNVSIRKMTKKHHDELYGLLVAGYLLATVKEALAVAPGLASIRIVGVRGAGRSAYGVRRGEAIVAAVIPRAALNGVHWQAVDARTILNDVASELTINERGANKALQPLDLAKEPELEALVSAIDFEVLGEG